MIRKLLVASAVVAAGLTVPGSPAPATTDPGPTSSDVAPIPRNAQYPPSTGSARLAGTLDAANTYRQVNFPTTSSPYNYLEEQMQIVQESPIAAGTSYFSPTQFYLDSGSNNGGYVGLQNQLYMPGVGNVGKGAIFSVWGAVGGNVAGCPQTNGHYDCKIVNGSENGETFSSVHLPYQWVQGHAYQFEVHRYAGSGATPTTLQARLYDLTTSTSVGLGLLYVPSTWGGFSPKLIQWQEEYFPNSYTSCSAIPVYKTAYWSAVWFARGIGDNTMPFAATDKYIDANDGAHCQNSVSVDAGVWPSGWPDPVGGEAIGSTTY